MGSGAAPLEILSSRNGPGSDRVGLDVSCSGNQVLLIHRARKVSALPKVSYPALSLVYTRRIALVRLSHGDAQAIHAAGDENHVDMVGHEAVAPYFSSRPGAPFHEQLGIKLVIVLPEESLLTAIPPLRHMMRDTWRYCPCYSCHGFMKIKDFIFCQ